MQGPVSYKDGTVAVLLYACVTNDGLKLAIQGEDCENNASSLYKGMFLMYGFQFCVT